MEGRRDMRGGEAGSEVMEGWEEVRQEWRREDGEGG